MPEDKEIAVVKRQVTLATTAAEELDVKDKESLDQAVNLLTKIKTVAKLVNDRKDSFTRPAYNAYKQIMEEAKKLWNPLLDDCAKAETIVKAKSLEYKKKVDAQAKIDEKKIADRVDAGKLKEETGVKKMQEIERVEASVETSKGSASFRKVRVVKVIDESQIPRDYLVVDMVKVRKDALAGVSIPGVEVVEEEQMAGSTRL